VGGGLIPSALVPGVFAVALLVSPAIRRPLLARVLTTSDGIAAARLTIAWGIALLGIAAGQLAGALAGFGSITSPAGFVSRFGFALAVETILLAPSVAYLRRSADTTDPSLIGELVAVAGVLFRVTPVRRVWRVTWGYRSGGQVRNGVLVGREAWAGDRRLGRLPVEHHTRPG
jgi:hypothetical protein